MASYTILIFYSLVGGLFSLIGAVLMLSHNKFTTTLEDYGTPFAAGALLAAVFLDLLKDGLEESSINQVLVSALIGIIIFFFAERFLHWFHHHHQHEDHDPSIPLIVIGDTIHNALDGVAIAAAFLISVPTGIITTIAVAAHEIPHEIGDFGLLLSKGLEKRKVLIINILSSLATTIAAIISFSLGKTTQLPIGILLGMSAGFLLYIAMSDIIPTIHEKSSDHRLFDMQPLLMLLGVALVAISIQIADIIIKPVEAPSPTVPAVRNLDDHGIEHGHSGHDHSTMN